MLHAVSYLRSFMFTADRLRSPISHLSGGERNRLLLARLFTQPANVLVLDEPTNDLDLETIELLEDLLVSYAGTLLLVSHDREFLDNVTTSTLVLEPGGRIVETVGGYTDWAHVARQRHRRSGRKGGHADRAGRADRTDRTDRTETDRGSRRPGAQPNGPRADGARRDGPRKLTWREGRELAALPERIERLEADQAALHARLAEPDFYQRAGDEVARVVRRSEELARELAAVYARWQELEDLAP